MSQKLWHYTVSRTQFGPVSEEEIIAMLKSSRLKPEALVWHDGLPNWVSIASVPTFAPFAPATTSLPPTLPPAFQPSEAGPLLSPPPPLAPSACAMQTSAPGGNYSGFWKRFAASFLDGLVCMVLNFVVGLVVKESSIQDDPIAILVATMTLNSFVCWLYFAIQESSGAQATLGKMALGIRVVDLNGGRISFGQATGRYFGKFLSSLTFCIGFLMVAFTDRKQGLHDKMAGTLVVCR